MATERHTIEIEFTDNGTLRVFENGARSVGEFTSRVEDAGRKVDGAKSFFDSFGGAATSFNQALELAAKGLNAARTAADFFFQGIERGGNLDDLSQKLGVSVGFISSLDVASIKAGVSVESLSTSSKILSRNMVEVAGGGGEALSTFRELGVSVTDASGKLRSTDEVLLDLADAFSGIEDGAGKTAAQLKIFGKSGTELAAFLNLGSEGLERFIALNKDLGLTLTGEQSAALDDVGDNFSLLSAAVLGATQQLAVGLAPALTEISNELVEFAANIGIGSGSVADIGAELGAFARDAAEPFLASLREMSTRAKEIGLAQAFREQEPAILAALADIGRVAIEKAVQIGIDIGVGIADGLADSITQNASDYELAGATIGALVVGGLVGVLTRSPTLALVASTLGVSIGSELADAFGGSLVQDVEETINKAFENADPKKGLASIESALQQARGLVARGIGGEEAAQSVLVLEDAYRQMADKAEIGATATRNFAAAAGDGKRSGDDLAGGLSEGAKAAADFAKEIANASSAAAAQRTIYAQAAAGTISLAEADQRAAAASAALSKGITSEAAAQSALAAEREKAAVTATKGAASLQEQIGLTTDQITALRGVADAHGSAEEAERALVEVAADHAAKTVEQTTGNQELADSTRALTLELYEQQKAQRALQQSFANEDKIDVLTAQLAIHKQIAAGILSQAEGERALAVEAAGTDAILRDQAGRTHDLQDAIEQQESSYIRLGDTIKDSLGQVFDALIAGTLDFGDAAESFGLAVGKRWVEGMLESKFRDFDPAVKSNFLDLGEFGKSVFGDLFSDGSVNLPGPTRTGGGGEAVDIFLDEDRLRGLGFSSDQIAELQRGGTTSDVDDVPIGGFRGQSWAETGLDAAGGAAAGYGTFSALNPLGPGSTGLDGLIAKGAEQGINNSLTDFFGAISTVVGAVLSIWLGPLGGVVSGAVGAVLSGLWADSIDRDTLRTGDFDGFAEFQKWFDPLAFGLTTLFLDLPTLGTAFRRAGESALDASKTFGGEDGKGGLQALLGDFSRSGESNQRGPEIALERGLSQGQVDTIMGGTGSIFSQMAEGELPEDAGRFAEAMGRTMSEFLSRGLAEGMDFADMTAALRSFAEESGVTLESSIRNLPNVLEQSKAAALEFGKLDPFTASEQAADAYAQQVLGISAIFEGDLPAGVNLASIALQTMEKDGVRAFEGLDSEGKATLTNLTQDAALLQDVIANLVSQGFQIDTADFTNAVADISASATFIGENIGGAFTGPSVTAGIAAMGEQLKSQVTGAIGAQGLSELFDTTNIAASFEDVFSTLRQLQEGAFADQGGVGGDAFRSQIVAAIADGKATLDEFIPQLRAIRDATEEVNEAIDEALKPSDAEQFWISLEETIKANKDAIDGMAASLFEVAANAEAISPGSGRDAARAAMDQTIDQSAFGAAQAAAGEFATKSPQGDALAQLTAQFQFKIAAAFQDGVISAEEKLDLARLKGKMDEAGKVLADSISSGSEALSDLFKADRLKEAIESAADTLKSAVGSGSDSMFDVIGKGGSVSEGVKAFGESFRGSVRDNILQGMQEALVQSVVMEGALATLMGQMKQAVSVALEDGFIDADEQAFIDGLAKGIGTATDQTIAALQPTLQTLGGIAETVAGNSDKAEAKIEELDKSTKNASYGVDEMARRAARSLEGVGDAVGPEVTDGIKDGLGALREAVGTQGSGPVAEIGAGLGALKDAIGGATIGPAAEIGAGVEALRGALGSAGEGPAADIAAGVGTIRDALGASAESGLAGAAAQVAAAFGDGSGAGVTGAAGALIDALGVAGATGAVADASASLRDELGVASDDVAAALRGNFASGLDQAEASARKLAAALDAFKLPGAATGGTFANGAMAVVGERGPEVVMALDGGGFRVEPITHEQMNMLLGGGTPGFATGGELIPISGRRFGYGGRPTVPPPPAPPRPGVDAGEDAEQTISVSFNFDSAMDAFVAGGTREELHDGVMTAVGEGLLAGMKQGLLASIGLEEFQEKVAAAIERGASEAELIAMGEEFAAKAEDAIAKAGPAFEAVAKTFGISVKEEVDAIELDPANMLLAAAALGDEVLARLGETQQEVGEALIAAAQTAAPVVAQLVGGSLSGLISDPAKLNFETFSQSLRGSIYQNVAGGLIDAFVESAVIQGALAPMLGAISVIFDQIGQKQLTVAEANGLIAEQIGLINGVLIDPAFKASIETLLSGIKDIGTNLDAFPPAAREVETSAVAVSDAVDQAEADVCDGKCGLQKEIIEYGATALDDSGREGTITDTVWREVPRFGKGGLVDKPTLGLIGEAGPELIIPLEALRNFTSGTVDRQVIEELQAASGAFETIMEGKDSALFDAIAGLSESFEIEKRRSDDLQRAIQEMTGATVRDIREAPPSVAPAVQSAPTPASGNAEERQLLRQLITTVDRLARAVESQPVELRARVGDDALLEVFARAFRVAREAGWEW